MDDSRARELLTAAAVREQIRFSLGQAPASLYAQAHMKSPATRTRAIDALTEQVAARFGDLEVTRKLPPNWRMP